MCGIVGYTGPTQAGKLEEVCALIAHRGPDAAGLLVEPPIHLGHRRLAIQDLSDAGRQPMESHCGRFVMVYNGELYNTPELRAELEKKGVRFRSTSDTEVLLELFARQGVSILPRLNGIFAFAVWDRQRRQLVLARDHFGIKPLYYAVEGGHIYFCSEMKGLLRFPQVSRSLNLNALNEYLTFLWVPQPNTIFERIHHLEAAHYAEFSPETGRLKIHRYWDLASWQLANEPLPSLREDDLVEQTRHLLRQAVRRQMLSDVPVGAFLSGGLDSSAIVAEMRDSARGRTDTYTIKADSKAFDRVGFADDFPYAKQVANVLDVDLKVTEVTPNIADELSDTLYYLDEPIADPAAINTYLICRKARRSGTVVMLSGVGGDELFGGYRRHLAARYSEYWDCLPDVLKKGLSRVGMGLPMHLAPQRFRPSVRRIRKLAEKATQTPDRRLIEYFFWSSHQTRQSVLSESIRTQTSRWPGETHRRHLGRLDGQTPLNQSLYLDLMTFMPSLNLTYNDRMSMRVGVEVRVPFLDLDLVAFAWRLPDTYKIRRFTTKYLLKKALEPQLPKDVIYRKKTGFGVPLRHWLHSDLQPMARDMLSPDRLRRRGLFDGPAISRLLDEERQNRADHSYLIWALLSFEIWAERMLND